MLDKIAKEFDFAQRALRLRAYRTEVLAGNMANAETPNYKAVDFDFSSELKAQLSGSGSDKALALVTTNPRHVDGMGAAGNSGAAPLQYRGAVQPSIDGNTVDMDVERGAFMENALKYQSTLTFLNQRISSLNTILKG